MLQQQRHLYSTPSSAPHPPNIIRKRASRSDVKETHCNWKGFTQNSGFFFHLKGLILTPNLIAQYFWRVLLIK